MKTDSLREINKAEILIPLRNQPPEARPNRETGYKDSDMQTQWYMRDALPWLPFPQQITNRISVLDWQCLVGVAPAYLQEPCCSTQGVQYFGSLRSSRQVKFFVRQHHAFSTAGSAIWNELPVTPLRTMPRALAAIFYSSNLKAVLFNWESIILKGCYINLWKNEWMNKNNRIESVIKYCSKENKHRQKRQSVYSSPQKNKTSTAKSVSTSKHTTTDFPN